ncbi:MAG: envelope stress response membrane protein PspC [Parvularculaceae bacterium]
MRKRRRRQEDWHADIDDAADRFGREAARFADRVGGGINRMADAFDEEMRSGRDGYAYHAGDAGPGPNRHRLYRNRRQRKIAGVCAGIAEYFGWNVKWLRIGAILATVFFFPFPIIAYGVAALLMKSPAADYRAFQTPEDERFWRTYSVRPKVTYSDLRHRFRALETRIEQMEYAVTTNEYGLRRQFRDLERGA